jgi:hypothetical protein
VRYDIVASCDRRFFLRDLPFVVAMSASPRVERDLLLLLLLASDDGADDDVASDVDDDAFFALSLLSLDRSSACIRKQKIIFQWDKQTVKHVFFKPELLAALRRQKSSSIIVVFVSKSQSHLRLFFVGVDAVIVVAPQLVRLPNKWIIKHCNPRLTQSPNAFVLAMFANLGHRRRGRLARIFGQIDKHCFRFTVRHKKQSQTIALRKRLRRYLLAMTTPPRSTNALAYRMQFVQFRTFFFFFFLKKKNQNIHLVSIHNNVAHRFRYIPDHRKVVRSAAAIDLTHFKR